MIARASRRGRTLTAGTPAMPLPAARVFLIHAQGRVRTGNQARHEVARSVGQTLGVCQVPGVRRRTRGRSRPSPAGCRSAASRALGGHRRAAGTPATNTSRTASACWACSVRQHGAALSRQSISGRTRRGVSTPSTRSSRTPLTSMRGRPMIDPRAARQHAAAPRRPRTVARPPARGYPRVLRTEAGEHCVALMFPGWRRPEE